MDRRKFLNLALATSAVTAYASRLSPGHAAQAELLARKIPSTGQAIPILGMGTWITFNVGKNQHLRDKRVEVLSAFFAGGGRTIDSSPMYGSSEEVVGYCLAKLPPQEKLFTATKVWTVSQWMGERQMQTSEKLWRQDRFDLMQIHNLVDWEAHLETLEGCRPPEIHWHHHVTWTPAR